MGAQRRPGVVGCASALPRRHGAGRPVLAPARRAGPVAARRGHGGLVGPGASAVLRPQRRQRAAAKSAARGHNGRQRRRTMIGMSQAGMPQLGGGHAVSWYSLDADGVEAVAQFVAAGWAQGDGAVLLATASHLVLIEEALERLGSDPEAMRIAGRYVARDAEETLALFVEDGMLDVERFHEAADPLLTEAGRDGSHVRAFGEM